jgi:hypothetical protein
MSREVLWEECVRASHDPIELARMCGMTIEGAEMDDNGKAKPNQGKPGQPAARR